MNLIRNGETIVQSSEYDPNADLMAHTASHKKAAVEYDSFLSKDQLVNLRKVQNERIEVWPPPRPLTLTLIPII